MKELSRGKILILVSGGLLFIYLMIFFTSIHPLVIYDSDDWLYISYRREALPDIHEWNPTKVLPETLLPVVSDMGAHIIRPFIGDYIFSLTVAYALTGSTLILIWFVLIYILLEKKFGVTYLSGIMSCFLFIFLCFTIYRHDWTQNSYMFWARDLNCFFNYIIPGIVNTSIVIFLLCEDFRELKGIKLGFLLLITYLAIFSNLFHSAILATFAASRMLISINTIKKGFKEYCLNHWYEIFAIVLWLISAMFEAGGGRASVSGGITVVNIVNTIKGFFQFVYSFNKPTCLAILVVNICAVALYISNREKVETWYLNAFITCCISESLLICYLILLCAKVDKDYVLRSDAMFGMTFWILLITTMSFAFILKCSNKCCVLYPIIMYLLMCNLLNAGRNYRETNEMRIWHEKCIAVDNYLIDQIVEADKQGKYEMTLYVPVGVDDVNWPHAENMGGRFANSLYQHGIISRYMEVTVVPDRNVNEMFNLGY